MQERKDSTTQYAAGFSLLELLVVLGILVAIAGIGTAYYDTVAEDKKDDLTRIELNQLAAAVKQFHTDTGFWPGYADLDEDGDTDEHNEPFDWSILTDTSLANWDAVSNRGWRGPYINKILNRGELVSGSYTGITIIGGKAIAITGLDSGDTDDLGPIFTTLIDPYGGPYVLLALNNRNVIVSRGRNGVFDELGGNGASGDASSESDPEAYLYSALCTLTYTSDDLAVCP